MRVKNRRKLAVGIEETQPIPRVRDVFLFFLTCLLQIFWHQEPKKSCSWKPSEPKSFVCALHVRLFALKREHIEKQRERVSNEGFAHAQTVALALHQKYTYSSTRNVRRAAFVVLYRPPPPVRGALMNGSRKLSATKDKSLFGSLRPRRAGGIHVAMALWLTALMVLAMAFPRH